jgi:hypothetical protein
MRQVKDGYWTLTRSRHGSATAGVRCMVWFGGPPHLLGPSEPAVDFAPVRRDLQESESKSEREKERSEERDLIKIGGKERHWREGETGGRRRAEWKAGRVITRRRTEGRESDHKVKGGVRRLTVRRLTITSRMAYRGLATPTAERLQHSAVESKGFDHNVKGGIGV